MECFCDCIPELHVVLKSLCLIAVFFIDNVAGLGMAVLITISILHLLLNTDKTISMYLPKSLVFFKKISWSCVVPYLIKKI